MKPHQNSAGNMGKPVQNGRPNRFDRAENGSSSSNRPYRQNNGTSQRRDRDTQQWDAKKKKNRKKQRVFFHKMVTRIPLSKLLTKARYLSAGLARQYIESGRVRINSRVILSPFYEVNLRKERVTIDEAAVEYPRRLFYIVFNKTREMLCESGDEGFDTVFDPASRWSFPFGRLRKSLSGLVIVSNDPRMITTHNKIDLELQKEYRIRISSKLTEEQLNDLRTGVRVGEDYFVPLRVEVASVNRKGTLLDIAVLDDSYATMFAALKELGCEVVQARRIRIALLQESSIPPGEWRELAGFEVAALGLQRFMVGELPPEEPEERFERRRFERDRDGDRRNGFDRRRREDGPRGHGAREGDRDRKPFRSRERERPVDEEPEERVDLSEVNKNFSLKDNFGQNRPFVRRGNVQRPEGWKDRPKRAEEGTQSEEELQQQRKRQHHRNRNQQRSNNTRRSDTGERRTQRETAPIQETANNTGQQDAATNNGANRSDNRFRKQHLKRTGRKQGKKKEEGGMRDEG